MTYEDLLIEASAEGLKIKECPLKAYKGRIRNNKILIKKDMSQNEKKCILAEELGHYYTSVGDILDQTKENNRKQEHIARRAGVKILLNPAMLVDACINGCNNLNEVAEFLNITEEFLIEGLNVFKAMYGCKIKIDSYTLFFTDFGFYVKQV